MTVSATKVETIEIAGNTTVTIAANVKQVILSDQAQEFTIDVTKDGTIGNMTMGSTYPTLESANVVVTGSGVIKNVDVIGNKPVTITAPEGSAITVEKIVNTSDCSLEIVNNNEGTAKLPAAAKVTAGIELDITAAKKYTM